MYYWPNNGVIYPIIKEGYIRHTYTEAKKDK